MKNFILLVVIVCGSYLAKAHIEPTYFLHGNIGSRKVGVQIDHFSEAAYMKYFYQNEKTNLYLKGKSDSTKFHFESALKDSIGLPVQKVVIEHLTDEKWEGFLITDKDSLIIKLEVIDVDKIDHLYVNDELKKLLSPYSYLRTSDLELVRVNKRERFGRFSVSWFKEPFTGVKHFQINSNRKTKDVNKPNVILRNDHLKHVESFFECGTYGYSGSYSEKINISFLNQSYLSYSSEVKSSCYSEREKVTNEYTNLELQTGKRLWLEDLIYVGDLPIPTYNTSFWFKYRRNEFASFVIDQLKTAYPEKFTKEMECNYENTKAWEKPSWYLTKKGLYLGASFPGIDRSCNDPEWSIIPYNRLSEYFIGVPID